jgi:hypothetical protein
MKMIGDILKSQSKPKEKQVQLVEAVCKDQIKSKEFIEFFISTPDVDKVSCADGMKHISKQKSEILAPLIETLVNCLDYRAPLVK